MKKLNVAYRAAIEEAQKIDSYLMEDERGAENALREAQRAWVVFRDKACEAEGYVAHLGTMEPLLVSSCKAQLSRTRAEGLLWFSTING